ncbi:MAG: DNA repair protein RecN [bacterium]
MITTLRIENFAIIDRLIIELSEGFSVFSGETGAGKSVLITALGLLLGGRAYEEYIRSGEESATVEGVFKVAEHSSIMSYLDQKGIDPADGGEILIKRKIFRAEKSNRCYINHQPCSVSVLAEIGKWLVDIHGQHEHQFLLSPERHIDILDTFGNLKSIKDQFAVLYAEYEQMCRRLLDLVRKEQLSGEERDLLRFQMQEIDQAGLSQEEEQMLEKRRRQLQNAEKLFQELTLISQELYEKEGSLHERLGKLSGSLRQLARIDDCFSSLADSVENMCYQAQEVSSQCTDYLQGIEFEPHLLDEVEARAAEIQKLKRKYGGSIQDILDERAKMEKKWLSVHRVEDEMGEIQKKIENMAVRVLEIAEKLSSQRQKIASDLEQKIKRELTDLCLTKAVFRVSQERKRVEPGGLEHHSPSPYRLPNFPFRLTSKGLDLIEFFFSANQGEELKPLARIASGGEISRILLALKACLKSADEVPVLVFDEVDVGIGGDISRVVGRKLKELSTAKQVLCITHSPQIASLADHHYMVKKVAADHRTTTTVEHLENGQRIEELARMLGGGVASDITFTHARELIEARDC